MDEGVTQNEVEQTTTGEQTAPEQSFEESKESTSEQTGEVLNAPEVTQTPEDTTNIMAQSEEVYKPNYFRDNEQLSQFEAQVQQQTAQAQIGGNQDLSQLRDLQLLQMQAQLARIDEERKWEQAVNKYPELTKNKAIDDIVYRNYLAEKARNPSVTPLQIADEFMKVLNSLQKKTESEAYTKAEDDISAKVIASRTPSRRSPNTGEVDETKSIINNYKKSGDEQDLLDLLRY